MWTFGERIRCECGKQFTLVVDPDERPTMRCHMCGRLIDLSFVKVAAAEKAAAAQAREREARLAQARQANFGGLRFDGAYRTPSPVAYDGSLAAAFELCLRFAEVLEVGHAFQMLDYEDGAAVEVEDCSGRTGFEVAVDGVIRVSFDTGVSDCELEGSVRGGVLELAYRIEEYGALMVGTKCVREGEARLIFERDVKVEQLAEPGAAADPAS